VHHAADVLARQGTHAACPASRRFLTRPPKSRILPAFPIERLLGRCNSAELQARDPTRGVASLRLGEIERTLVLSVSAATIDRLLADVKVAAAGGRRRRVGLYSAIRREVPLRTFNDWNDPPARLALDHCVFTLDTPRCWSRTSASSARVAVVP
jgi:hypothetical protein